MATFSASAAVGEVLRQPDDLVKLSAFRNKLLKEKTTLDAKLAEGVRTQLDATRDALLKLQESRAAAAVIREEMIEVEKLKRDKEEGEAFDKITRISSIHRNFAQTAKMVTQLQSMADKVEGITRMLQHDKEQPDGRLGPSANLLPIHFQLQQLEAFRNETLHEAKRGAAKEDQGVLKRWFEPLDQVAAEFEEWLWEISSDIIQLVRKGNAGTVVRLLKIIEFEGREDEKAVALRLVRKVANNDAASKFRSMQANARVIKNYRHKFLNVLEHGIKQKFDQHLEDCQGDMLHFISELQFLYKDLIRIKDDIEPLFPADYEIVQWLVKRYHQALNATLLKVVESGPEAAVLLELHVWTKGYRRNMKDLDIPAAWLQPPLLEGKAQDLMEDYVRLIITKLDEWTTNLQREEMAKFRRREQPPNQSIDGLYGTDGVNDFFALVNQQIDLALESNQGAVLARVVTESSKLMRRTQGEWVGLVAAEIRLQAERKPEEVAQGLTEYVMALANDQLRAADLTEALQTRLEPLVSDKYKPVIAERLDEAINGYLDVAKKATNILVDFVFNDLRPATRALMGPTWYSPHSMTPIIETLKDYLADYQAHLLASIFEMLLDDLLDAFMIVYLTALRRVPAKGLRMPIAVTRIREDITSLHSAFQGFKNPEELENSLQVMDTVCDMLGAAPEMVIVDYWNFAKTHGPQLQFVESILRGRDDLDRSSVSEIMESLKSRVREEGLQDPPEATIMVKVQGTSGAAGLMANLNNLKTQMADRAGNLRAGMRM